MNSKFNAVLVKISVNLLIEKNIGDDKLVPLWLLLFKANSFWLYIKPGVLHRIEHSQFVGTDYTQLDVLGQILSSPQIVQTLIN